MKRSYKILIAIIVSILASAITESLVPVYDIRGIEIAHTFFLAIMAFTWCKAHIKENKIEEPRGSSALCALFIFFGAPLYFYRGYGLKQGSILCLYFVGFFILSGFIYMTTTYISNYVQ